MQRTIPILDLSAFTKGTSTSRTEFVQELGTAFHDVGFVGIINHGISKELIADFYKEAYAFFLLPENIKLQSGRPDLAGQRGYTSFGTEHAKHTKIADLKEFFQIGQQVSENDPEKSKYPDNVIVQQQPRFSQLGMELYRAFENTGMHLLRAISLHLNLSEFYFDTRIARGNSILRAIYYPPILNDPASAIRAEQHEDINLITLLVGASAGGLQLLTKENVWRDVVPEKDEIVINVGDMLQRLTNNYLKSTTHRVINPHREQWHLPRLSIPFFLHPVSDMDLTCLPNMVTPDMPAYYPPITAGEYLDERLREIGLKK